MSNQQLDNQLDRYLSFLAQDENNLKLLLDVSDLYLQQGDLATAQNYLDKASHVDRVACLGHQGMLHFYQGDLAQAQQFFIEALEDEDTPMLRQNLGLIYFLNSDLENASHTLSPLMKGNDYAEAKLLMAHVLHGQNNLDQALGLVNELLEHDPNHAEALGFLALVHFDMENHEQAVAACQRALALNPDNYEARLIHIMTRLPEQTVTTEEIEDLLQMNADDCRLWFSLGSVEMGQGNFVKAEQSFRKALAIHPEFYDCQIALGWCLLLANNLEQASIIYQTATNQEIEIADGWGGLALIAALKEDFLKAEQLIQQAQDLNPECFLAEIAEAIYFNHKNPLKAKAHLVKALKSTQVPISEKLAMMIEEVEPIQLH